MRNAYAAAVLRQLLSKHLMLALKGCVIAVLHAECSCEQASFYSALCNRLA